jgi:hypothetical protein
LERTYRLWLNEWQRLWRLPAIGRRVLVRKESQHRPLNSPPHLQILEVKKQEIKRRQTRKK